MDMDFIPADYCDQVLDKLFCQSEENDSDSDLSEDSPTPNTQQARDNCYLILDSELYAQCA